MIKLTMIEGDAVYLSPERITGVYCGGQATSVSIGGEEAFSVTESPEEVAQKVLEYKLAMERYKTGYAEALKNQGDPQWIFENAELILSSLAGLEEQKDEV